MLIMHDMNDTITTTITARKPHSPMAARSVVATGSVSLPAITACMSGTARITRGEETYVLEENQSTYIPVGVRHRIENPGPVALHIIEVQSGSYLGEDDIVRLEDRYGRQGTNT